MVVFRYDKSWEGLLTVVFDAYARRMWPEVLLAGGEPAPLFTAEEHTVVTDSEKSGRVWAALTKKLPGEVLNMLVMGWLSEEAGVDMMLARYIKRVLDGGDHRKPGNTPGVYTDFADRDVLRIKQLALKVSREREHVWQFTRFQKGADGETYYAPVSPRYNVLPLAIPWFRDRFRDQRWLIYDIGRHYGYYYDLHDVTEVTMEDDKHLVGGELDAAMLADDEKPVQRMWREYVGSMAIAERINPRLQRGHMPRRFWPLLPEMAGTVGTPTAGAADLATHKRRR